jgi:hypothetical protein
MTSDDLVQGMLASGAIQNPHVGYAHQMLRAAGYAPDGSPLPQGTATALPSREQRQQAGVQVEPAPQDDAPPGPPVRGTGERLLRLPLMVIRAPMDAAANMVTQLDNLRAATMAQIGNTFGPAFQEAFGYLSGVSPDIADPAGEQPLGFGEQLETLVDAVLAQPETGLEKGVHDVAMFLTAMVPAVKGLQAAGLGMRGSLIAGSSVSEFFALDPHAPSVLDAVHTWLPVEWQQFIKNYIKDPAPDDQAAQHFRTALEQSGFRALFDGIVLGALFEGLISTSALLRHGHKSQRVAGELPQFSDQTLAEVAAQRQRPTQVLDAEFADIGRPQLQHAAREGADPTQAGRLLPPRAGETGRAGRPTIEAFPSVERAPIQAATQAALPAGRPVLALPQGVTPAQAVEELYTILRQGSGRVSTPDVQAAIPILARKFGRSDEEVLQMLRLGERLETFKTQGFRRVPLESPSATFTSAEGEIMAATAYFRKQGLPEGTIPSLVALVGLAGGAGAAAFFGDDPDLTGVQAELREAGIGAAAARGLARLLKSLGQGLDDATEEVTKRRAASSAAAERGGRRLVHDPATLEEPVQATTETAGKTASEGSGVPASEAAKAATLLDTAEPITIHGVRKDIPFHKLDTDEDVQQVLAHISDLYEPAITEARRLGTPMRHEAALAKTMGMTVDDLHAFAGAASVLPKVAAAANEMLVASGKRLTALRDAVLAGGDQAVQDEYVKQFVIHGKIQRSVGAIRAESGRTLGMYRLTRTGDIDLLHRLSAEAQRVRRKTGVTARQLAEAHKTLPPEQATKLARDMTKPNASGALMEYWINSILSSPKTLLANVSGTAMGLMLAPTERAITRQWARVTGADVASGEATAMLYGYMNSVQDAMQLFWTLARDEKTGIMGSTRLEAPKYAPQFTAEAFNLDPQSASGALVNTLGYWIRTPGRLLSATDSAAKLLLYRAELAAQATREASRQSVRPEQWDAFVAKFVSDPPEGAIVEAAHKSEIYTFTNALNDPSSSFQTLRILGESVQMAKSKSPMLALLAPFVRTPVNLAVFGAERTPVLNLMSRTFQKQLRSADPLVRSEALTKLTMSGGVMGLIATLSASGLVTGSGPRDPYLKRRLEEQGVQWNAIRVGEKWVDLNRADPLGMMFGVSSDLASIIGVAEQHGIPERDIQALAGGAILAFANIFTNRTYLRGVAQTLDAVRGGKFGEQKLDAATRITVDMLGGMVPNVVAEMRRTLDPVRREMETAIDRISNRIPGLSPTLAPDTNDWGDPVLYGHGLGAGIVNGLYQFLSPFRMTNATTDPVSNALADNDIAYGGPSKFLMGVELTAAEHNAYKKLSADTLVPAMERLIASPSWERLTAGRDGGRAMLFARIRDQAIQRAQALLLRDPAYEPLRQRIQTYNVPGRLVQPAQTAPQAPTGSATDRLRIAN